MQTTPGKIFDFKRFLVLLAIIVLGMAVMFAKERYGIEFNPSIAASISIIVVVFFILFLWFNRGKNIALLKVLTGESKLLTHNPDGSYSGKCPKCKSSIQYTSTDNTTFVFTCQSCTETGSFKLQ